MGGKGGGNEQPGWMPYWQAEQDKIAKAKAEADAKAAADKAASDKAAADQAAADKAAAKAAADAKTKADKDAAAKAAADKAAADKLARETPLGPPISAGGAITQPDLTTPGAGLGTDTTGTAGTGAGAGDLLGGAVVNPPSYWTGGAENRSVRKPSLTTTD
jgi:membrane protein involved in colicin uptake